MRPPCSALASIGSTSRPGRQRATTITAVGREAQVNGKLLAPPLTVRAIGNPKELKGALEMNEGIVQKVGLKDLQIIDIRERPQLELPAYSHTRVAGSAPESARQAAADR